MGGGLGKSGWEVRRGGGEGEGGKGEGWCWKRFEDVFVYNV